MACGARAIIQGVHYLPENGLVRAIRAVEERFMCSIAADDFRAFLSYGTA